MPAPRSSAATDPFASSELLRDWRMLCETLGERRAGTDAEHRAAEYVARRFASAGASEVRTESFPCTSLRRATAEVKELRGAKWHRVPAVPLVGAPGTGNRALSGNLTWLEMPENAPRLRPGSLRGQIAAIFGPLPTSVSTHRRLLAAEPLAVIHVDDRLPFPWTKNDGVYPYWVRKHGMPPTLTVPYTEGWGWRRDGVQRLEVKVVLDQEGAVSRNVIAEFTGSQPQLPSLVLAAHHDTQCGNPGADDNASGVVCLLALARAFTSARNRRTIRLISFGTEEQLSVGSFAYAKQHRVSPKAIGLVINFDSVSSPLGHWMMSIAGSTALARHATRQLAARGLDVDARSEITPFSDHFPFNRCGIPSLWFMRTNFPGGRWQHHSLHDTLENVSSTEVQRLLAAVHPLIVALAGKSRWPFVSSLPPAQLREAQRLGRELYG
jgi:hypothetical protein